MKRVEHPAGEGPRPAVAGGGGRRCGSWRAPRDFESSALLMQSSRRVSSIARAVLTFQSTALDLCYGRHVTATARARARAETTAAITEIARRHLAVDGAAALSLRAVARELGVVSSAVYRYVGQPGRAVDPPDHRRLRRRRRGRRGRRGRQPAAGPGGPMGGRRPGDPDVGARAPPRVRARVRLTGARLPRAGAHDRARLPGVARARSAWSPTPPPPGGSSPSDVAALAEPGCGATSTQRARRARRALPAALPADVLARALTAWTQLFGAISFELFGQTRNVITDHDGARSSPRRGRWPPTSGSPADVRPRRDSRAGPERPHVSVAREGLAQRLDAPAVLAARPSRPSPTSAPA